MRLRNLFAAFSGGLLVALTLAVLHQLHREARALRLIIEFVGLVPVCALVGLGVAIILPLLFGSTEINLGFRLSKLRLLSAVDRSKALSLGLTLGLWALICGLTLGRFSERAFAGVATRGYLLGLLSAATIGISLPLSLATYRVIRRALYSGEKSAQWWLEPARVVVLGASIFAAAIGVGAYLGDTSGQGPTALSLFGLLRRQELDLRPIYFAVAVFTGAYLFASTCVNVSRVIRFGLPLSSLGLLVHLWRTPLSAEVVESVEVDDPLAKLGLSLLRRLSDSDRDGVSARFGGQDCDDRDAKRSPRIVDVPGNGIDEDCTGTDTPVAMRQERVPAKGETSTQWRGKNLLLITIDTLRADVGFMGYSRPITPELDSLAAEGTVWTRMYAMASYTGKSLGPLMVGKYPSETLRDNAHFNRYLPANVTLAERLKAAGYKTFGAAPHIYFFGWSGVTQGFDEFDVSTAPKEAETDSVVSADRITGIGSRLIRKYSTGSPFFAWFHYFDPHAQYLKHNEAPVFDGPRGLYDGEVWFTDREIGKLLAGLDPEVRKNTIVCITSDHGEAFNEHRMNFHGNEIWESLVRVPFILVVPGQKPGRIDVRRSHVDIVPSLLDLLGVSYAAEDLSGESMLGEILRPETAVERDTWIDMPLGPNNPLRKAIIFGPGPGQKLIHFGGNRFSLFDLAKDPGELDDLASDPIRLAEAKAKFEGLRALRKEIEPREP